MCNKSAVFKQWRNEDGDSVIGVRLKKATTTAT